MFVFTLNDIWTLFVLGVLALCLLLYVGAWLLDALLSKFKRGRNFLYDLANRPHYPRR